MDIEHFYDGNPRRRSSEEYSFGSDWTDSGKTRWELNWVQDTGEVYLMREAAEPLEMDPFGDTRVPDMPVDEVTVEIIGTLQGLDTVERALGGWSQAMGGADSVAWVRDRVARAQAGDLPTEGGSDPSPTSLEGADEDEAPDNGLEVDG
jgi:hypothetical protein